MYILFVNLAYVFTTSAAFAGGAEQRSTMTAWYADYMYWCEQVKIDGVGGHVRLVIVPLYTFPWSKLCFE